MKLVFIASPFRAPTDWQRFCNVHRASEVALKVWKLGACAVCPQANSAHFHGEGPDDRYLAGYLALLARCDALLVVAQSDGVRAELAKAEELKLPVFHSLETLEAWIIRDEAPLFA